MTLRSYEAISLCLYERTGQMGHREFLSVSIVSFARVSERTKVRVIDVAFVVVQYSAKTMTTALTFVPLLARAREMREPARNF